MNDNVIYFARCSVGKGKWFWVTYLSDEYRNGNDPFAYGYAATPDEAEAMGVAAAREQHPDRGWWPTYDYLARIFKRCLGARKKANKERIC